MPATDEQRARIEAHWGMWVCGLYPDFARDPFAEHHRAFWDWVWSIDAGATADPFVAIWARGHAKSTSLELATVSVAARKKRRFGLYVSNTQDQADKHVATIATMLHAPMFAAFYPEHADRKLSKYGHSLGWTRNRLRTQGGFIIDALGLDTAARGVKVDEVRPDWLVLDDLDSDGDSLATTEKKVRQLTHRILPTRAKHAVVAAGQNLIKEDGIFGALAGRAEWEADFLQTRRVFGPIPAVEGLVTKRNPEGRYVIAAGQATWAGMDIPACQEELNTLGLSAFLAECQHEPADVLGGMFDHLEFVHHDEHALPVQIRATVWVDPAVTNTDHSDRHAIQVDSLGEDGRIYRLFSYEQRGTPESVIEKAIEKAYEYDAPEVGVETDQGGDLWHTQFDRAHDEVMRKRHDIAGALKIGRKRRVRFVEEKAGSGYGSKVHRAQLMLADYERGNIVHVNGTHNTLERALRRFPKMKPFDLVDAAFWSWNWLRSGSGKREMRDRRLAGRR
jgi:hypothetical protein